MAELTDYRFDVGYEFETGLASVLVSRANSTDSTNGICAYEVEDGGGVEVCTPILKDPTMFKIIAKYDAFLKNVRNDADYRPIRYMSNHFHMSINPNDNARGDYGRMNNKDAISHNFQSLLNKYTFALHFFDSLIHGGRRMSAYGMGLCANPRNSGVFWQDIRYNDNYHFGDSRYARQYYGRETLVRFSGLNSSNSYVHMEYRGSDHCPSGIFLGLKTELMKAIVAKAIAEYLDGHELEYWPQELADDLKRDFDNSFQIVHEFSRRKAKECVAELADFLPKYAIDGLTAWATYIDVLLPNAGYAGWFQEYEQVLAKRIGVTKFLTNKDLASDYQRVGNVLIRKEHLKGRKTGSTERVEDGSSLNEWTEDMGQYDVEEDEYDDCEECRASLWGSGLGRQYYAHRLLCDGCYDKLRNYEATARKPRKMKISKVEAKERKAKEVAMAVLQVGERQIIERPDYDEDYW